MINADREAFIALIAPIGINVDQVVSVLSERLTQVRSEPNVIKLTDFLKELGDVADSYPDEVSRYSAYIAAGDSLCEEAGRGDILAILGILRLMKGGESGRRKRLNSKMVHIIRQIKRIDEYNTLERIYGRNVLFVGCYAPKEVRVHNLVDRQKVSDRISNQAKLESKALEIISIDEDEVDKRFGQRVIDCYPKSDFILDCTSLKTLEDSCERLIEVYFGHPFISPTKDEYASYIANAASYRSLDLSRQVGAAIFGERGEIISMGCNEVPSPEGGTYWCDQHNDGRDYILGQDSNQRVKEDLARDALERLQRSGWLNDSFDDVPLSDLVEKVFKRASKSSPEADGPWQSAMIANIIEYGRMVHAEMNAITDAARFLRATQGATLYCTTMPCHMCAKLIIASGIKRVVYLQPYVKSLTAELYKDSIVFEGIAGDNRVNFTSLKGITPAGFKRAFHKPEKRKYEDGKATTWNKAAARPTFLSTTPYYINSEVIMLSELTNNSVVVRLQRIYR